MTETYNLYNINELQPGQHLCLMYKTEEEHRAVLTPYLRQGLEKGEKVLYIVDSHPSETIMEYLQDDGLAVESYLSSGQLNVVSSEDAYLRDGTFNLHRMIDILWGERGRALASGFPALRLTSEMTWVLRHPSGSEQLIEYEANLNKFFPSRQGFGNCLAICQYDQRRFKPELLIDVLGTHPIAITGTEVSENFYYIPPDDFLNPKRGEVQLRHHLRTLKDRRRREERMQGDEEQFRNLYDGAPIGIQLYDPNGKMITANKACREIFGVNDVADVEGFNIFNSLDRTKKVKEKVGDEKVVRFETTVDFSRVNFLNLVETTKSGTMHLDVLVSELTKGEKGFSGGYLVYLQDISQRKREEQMQQKSEDRFRSVIEVANDAVVSCDGNGNIISWNPRAEILFEHTEDDMMGCPLVYIVPERFRKSFDARIQKLVATGKADAAAKPIEVVGLRKTGGEFPLELSLARWKAGDGTFFTAIMRDITERKHTENELRIKDGAIAASVNAIALVDMKGYITYVNPAFLELWGYEEKEVLDKAATYFWQSPSSASKVISALPSKGWIGELYGKKKGGEKFYVQLSSSIFNDGSGKPVCMIASFVDLTGYKQPEASQENGQQLYGALTEASADPISVFDQDGRCLYANNAYAGLWGQPATGITGKNIADFMAADAAESTLRDIRRVFSADETIRTENTITEGKEQHVFLTQFSPIRDGDNTIISTVGISRDITEGKQLEAKLQGLYRREKDLRQKLDTEIERRVEFTKALVHELRTRLTPILASSELLITELQEEPWLSLAANVNRGAVTLNQKIDDLLDLARDEVGALELSHERVSLTKLLKSVTKDMIPVASNYRQALVLEMPPSLPEVWADERRLQQVFFNITSSACELTPEGGRITIRAYQDGGNVVVEVQYSGQKTPSLQEQRLEQPYHHIETDREYLSDISLALSKTLVELHNGQLWTEDKKEKGKVFGLSLPLNEVPQPGKQNVPTGGSASK